MSDHRRILIVSAGMGGGHLQVSRELQRRLVGRGHQVSLVDLLTLMPRPTGSWLGRLYPWLVARAPRLYDLIYEKFFLAPQRHGERVDVPVLLATPGLRRLVRQLRPAVTVSTYHLAALAAGRLRAQGEPTGTAITVITQFAVHDLWIHPHADLELTISGLAADDASARSGRPARICGPVVRPEFTVPPGNRRLLRAQLGIPRGARVALVVTGSLGLAGSAHRAAAAIAARPGWVPVVVCGRNHSLQQRLTRLEGAIVLGWVDDMAAVMSASDVLVDNAGGMCSKEALGLGLPVITFQPIAGHGRHDARELARLELTDLVDDVPALLRALDRLDGDRRRHADRVARGRALFVADAAEIIERVAGGGVRAVS